MLHGQDLLAGGCPVKINYFGCAKLMLRIEGRSMIVGYARVSTDGQTLDAQQAQLRSAGAEKVYSEKIFGAVTDRPALAKAIAALTAGDVLVVCKLDRLARSTRDLLNSWLLSLMLVQPLNHLVIAGPTQQLRMGG